MRDYKIRNANNEDIEFFQQHYPKHNATGFLKETFNDGRVIEKVILKMKPGYKGWTPSGTVRDCGDHYIIARYSSYDKLDKKTLEITRDVEDR